MAYPGKLRPAKGRARRGRRQGRKRQVYMVVDRRRAKRYAVKSNKNRTEALREYRVMASFRDHTHLVRAYRYFVRGGRGWILMEWLRGPSLQELVKARGPLGPRQAAAITLSILKGLEALHGYGFVHGDLHGRNVIVVDPKRSRIKIIDFQHAVRKNAAGRARARRSLPKPPLELAPESRGRVIDDRYDLYGAGYMCACMLAGRTALRRRPKRVPGGVEPGSALEALWKVAIKAMAAKPGRRFASARQMRERLQAILAMMDRRAGAPAV